MTVLSGSVSYIPFFDLYTYSFTFINLIQWKVCQSQTKQTHINYNQDFQGNEAESSDVLQSHLML